MSQPMTADYFVQHPGVDPQTAAALAAAHNQEAGIRTTTAAPQPMPAPAPTPQRAWSRADEAKIATSAGELQKLTGCDAATARSIAEQEFRYKAGTGIDK